MKLVRALFHKIFDFIRHPWKLISWIYGAYLTLRYVDSYNCFPAIKFRNRLIRLKVLKRKGSKLTIFGKLIIEPWIDNFASEIRLQEESEFKIANDFIIGDDVHIRLSKGAQVEFLGKKTNRAQASLQGQ